MGPYNSRPGALHRLTDFSHFFRSTVTARHYLFLCSTTLISLIFLCLAWEGWLAPIRPGGSWLTLKAAFLLPALFGVLRGKRYTYKWLSLFVQFYLLEGLTRATSDVGLSRWLAAGEIVLAIAVFASAVMFIRATRPAVDKKAAPAN